MHSFISSFRPFIAAALAIAAIETAVWATFHPNFVERSNFLDLDYHWSESFHKVILYQKLKTLAHSSPDIVQVGDSSGFFGIRPNIVMQHLGGLTYDNLSCCGNTGFEGYYDIAQFMLERNPSIKTVVLYVSLFVLPSVAYDQGDRIAGGQNRLYDALVSPWAALSPPSQSLRLAVTSRVYTLNGLARPIPQLMPPLSLEARAARIVAATRGWLMETDERMAPSAKVTFLAKYCDADVFAPHFEDRQKFYVDRWWGGEQFRPQLAFSRLADLAASYGARLVIAFQPNPCSRMRPQDLDTLRDALAAVKRQHANVTVFPEQAFEHWPPSDFTFINHLRQGYDVMASHRLGRLLAGMLGIPPAALPPAPAEYPDATAATPSVLDGDRPGPNWQMNNVAPSPLAADAVGGFQLIETDPPANTHWVDISVPGLTPNTPYAVSFQIKPIGDRSLRLFMQDKGETQRQGEMTCDAATSEAVLSTDAVEGDADDLPDGWQRCWASMNFCSDIARLRLYVLNAQSSDTYAGDGHSGVMIRNLQMQPGWRLVRDNGLPPLPPREPIAEPCPIR